MVNFGFDGVRVGLKSLLTMAFSFRCVSLNIPLVFVAPLVHQTIFFLLKIHLMVVLSKVFYFLNNLKMYKRTIEYKFVIHSVRSNE